MNSIPFGKQNESSFMCVSNGVLKENNTLLISPVLVDSHVAF